MMTTNILTRLIIMDDEEDCNLSDAVDQTDLELREEFYNNYIPDDITVAQAS